MNKYALALTVILTMLLFAFLKGYGEEKSMRAESLIRKGDSSFNTALGDLNPRTHERNIDDLILSQTSTSPRDEKLN